MATKKTKTAKQEIETIKVDKVSTNGDSDHQEEAFGSISREAVASAASMTRQEALSLVFMYQSIQKIRIGQELRDQADDRGVSAVLLDKPLVKELKKRLKFLESQAERGMKKFAEANPLGRWVLSFHGIGPVIAAGLLAHIDLTSCACKAYRGIPRHQREEHRCPGQVTAGGIWRFAGLDPTVTWEKGQKRPWNTKLKTLCWHLASCLKRIPESRLESLGEAGYYCRLYRTRKARENSLNEAGKLKEAANQQIAKYKRLKRSPSKEQRECWESGKLRPAGVDARAMRYVVKIFLSHFHQVGREILGMPMVKPWAIQHGGHVHYMAPPNWPMK